MDAHVIRKAEGGDVLAPILMVLLDVEAEHGSGGALEPLELSVTLRVVRRVERVDDVHQLAYPLE